MDKAKENMILQENFEKAIRLRLSTGRTAISPNEIRLIINKAIKTILKENEDDSETGGKKQ